MAGSTFLTLSNDVLKRFNEVQLTAATFDSCTGFHAFIKDSVNAAIQRIHQTEPEWPFNHSSTNQTLSSNVYLYAFPSTAIKVDMESFYLNRDDTLEVAAKHLGEIDYDMFLQRYKLGLLNATNDGSIFIPRFVFRTQGLQFGVGPNYPDRAYSINYEYWDQESPLVYATNTTVIPTIYDRVIHDFATSRGYRFKSDKGKSDTFEAEGMAGLKRMQSLLINKTTNFRDGRVNRQG